MRRIYTQISEKYGYWQLKWCKHLVENGKSFPLGVKEQKWYNTIAEIFTVDFKRFTNVPKFQPY